MLLRSSRWAANVLALGMSAAVAVAQPPLTPEAAQPSPSASVSSSAAFPQEAADLQWNHWYDDGGGSLFDELDLSSQFRFQADWVSYTRQNRSNSIPLFTGPDSVSQRDADFSHQSGYRLNLGFMNDDYELEGSFFQLDGLNGSQNGTLTSAVVFDGSDTFTNVASVATQGMLGTVESLNFLESTTLFSPINAAANHSGVAPNNETTELEFLDTGATYQLRYSSRLQDFDVNLKGRRQSGRLLRFGFGYRNIQLNEGGLAALLGSFNTVDNDPAVPDPSDGLSNAALTAVPGAGLTPANLGANGLGGFSEIPLPDQLLFTSATRATNQLNGVQATLDATFLESEYFSIGGYAKAGVYHNKARGSITETYQDLENNLSRYTRSFSNSQDRAAFAGNLGVTGTVFLRENLRLFGGYELMYLSGVALAPDQSSGIQTDIANVTSFNLQSHGQALFHGGRVGFEILFP